VNALVAALRRRHRALLESPDRGTTLMEVVVGMTIMTICGAIFIGAVVGLNRATGKAQAATNAATQTNQAFLNLDKMVRYAAYVSTPGKGSSGDWYVELRDTTNGGETCTQLRLNASNQMLQKRSWPAANAAAVTAFTPIASGLTNGAVASGSADQPFLLTTPGPTTNHQQLTVNLVATAGTPPSITTSRSSFTLTAVNSAVPVPTGTICRQVARP
jgi:enamine deaminase RidA (YjgF/YER057c/UK114 family)